MRPDLVAVRRDGNQLFVSVTVARPLWPGAEAVEFDPPIKVGRGDQVHFEVRAEHIEGHGTGMSASSFVQKETVLMQQDATVTRLFGY